MSEFWYRKRRTGSAWLVLMFTLVLGFGTSLQATAQGDDDSLNFLDPIKIGIIGDQTFSSDIQASYGVLQQGVDILATKDLDVVLHVGDLIESTLSPAEVTALWNQGTAILDQLPVSWYMTAGDHEVNPPVFQQDSPDRSREQLFQQLYGARVPAVLNHLYYSFNVGNHHFISLYSGESLYSDSRFGNIFLSQIYDDQFNWLANDLEANQNARAIVVFLHQPLWYHWSGWQRVHELLRQYRVAAVINGHLHYNQNNGELDGIRYISVGATGAFKKDGSREAGDVDHVSVLKVGSPHQVSIKLFALDSLPLKLTPRVDMDRVQALHVQLGNFFNFTSSNPVFLKNGQLVDACTNGNPATLEITQIGAPVDRPVEVRIDFTSVPAGVALSSPSFTPGECQTVITPTRCVMARNARTFFSNYSSVEINQSFGPALWQSGLTSGSPQPGTVLNLLIKTRFQGDSGNLFLQTNVSTTVQACP